LVVFYPSFYVVLKNWNRKCFWTSVVYILQNGLLTHQKHCHILIIVIALKINKSTSLRYIFKKSLCICVLGRWTKKSNDIRVSKDVRTIPLVQVLSLIITLNFDLKSHIIWLWSALHKQDCLKLSCQMKHFLHTLFFEESNNHLLSYDIGSLSERERVHICSHWRKFQLMSPEFLPMAWATSSCKANSVHLKHSRWQCWVIQAILSPAKVT